MEQALSQRQQCHSTEQTVYVHAWQGKCGTGANERTGYGTYASPIGVACIFLKTPPAAAADPRSAILSTSPQGG